MTHKAILCGLVLAACGSPANSPATGQTTPPASEMKTMMRPPAPDPALAFRLQYANPGGMWLPQQMTLPGHVDTFRKMGVALDPQQLADPLNAPLDAVIFLGNCTASFVSGDGLIVTNHHCVQPALQLNTDKKAGKNYLEDGFMAKTRADELTAGPGARVFVAQAFKDVTADMLAGLDQIKDPVVRKDTLDRHLKTLLAACEKGRPSIRCNIRPYFGGGLFIQAENLEIRDVRVVYAPARSVGDFGGEVDNWHWPRHTGDWSFYRAYVGKDGQPADYSPDNVPYQPKAHLQVTTAGLKPGDFVMITGYPGRTARTQTAAALHNDVEWRLPNTVDYQKARYAIAAAHVADQSETGTKATVMEQFAQNVLANNAGVLAGLAKAQQLVTQKDALDQQIKDWAAQPGHEVQKAALDKLEQLQAEQRRTQQVDTLRGRSFSGSVLLLSAIELIHWADERTKKDDARRAGYQDRDLKPAISQQKQLGRSYDRTLDRETFRMNLVRALALPEADRTWLATLLGARKADKLSEAMIDKALDAWYAAPALEDDKLRLSLLETGTLAQLRASKDPFIQAAERVWSVVKADEKKGDARVGDQILIAPVYIDVMKQVLGGQLAPDANASLRVSYGTVRSMHPGSADATDTPFTYAQQIVAKETGKEPFNSPAKLLAAIKARKFGTYADPATGDLPIDFLTDLDITGGNSGSPILNHRGELVGLAFDSTLEAVAADYVYNPDTNRSIGVDARYMIWTLDLLDGGDQLIKEMGLQPQLQ